ncbi:MAG: hypothetical protein LBH25_05540 [Fibromonadaceae bacterium]|jgi:hypothetical protein|nr:hypothetical protein [Fibromonadaceae bacterium]
MECIDEIESEYFSKTGRDFSFLPEHGIPKNEITFLMFMYDYSHFNIEQLISFLTNNCSYVTEPEMLSHMQPYLREFYHLYENEILGNADCAALIKKSAHVYSCNSKMDPDFEKYGRDKLYKYPKTGIKFVDLASGVNFIDFYGDLDKDTEYYLVDKSLFACECLEIFKKKKNISNVVVINKDVKDLQLEDIGGGKDIYVIRLKNIWSYVDNFHECIPKYQSFLMKDGIFLFQESSFCMDNFSPIYYNWLDGCFGEGWRKEEPERQSAENPRSLDSFIYRKI